MISGPILLPSQPGLKTDKPHMLDWGGALTPSLGGPVQTLMRLGTRHSLDFTVPTMPTEPLGRIWASRLRLAKLYGALLPFGQDGLAIGAPGLPYVNAAGQAGSTLLLAGFTAGYVVREGQAFNITHGGRYYLHFAAHDTTSTDGTLSLDIYPMLRVIPDLNGSCEFLNPRIQGSLSGNEVAWDRQTAPWSDFGTITITEDE
uniref:hypothetical protein n=1 Tax=uncultured Sphingomonas sp. TaxID=158754 RepID=UPI0035CCA4AC